MIAPDFTLAALAESAQAPALVRVPHLLWHLFGDVSGIARGLRDGHVVEFECGERWCRLAAGGAALQISSALREEGLRPTHSFIYRNQRWFIRFAPQETSQ